MEKSREKKMKIEEMWSEIIKWGIATNDELVLVTNFVGCTEEVLNKIIFFRTGFENLGQFIEQYKDLV
jgi:hypothetical protein